jgi:hypothetical protein
MKTSTYIKKTKSNVTKLNYCMKRASDGYLHKESHHKQKKYLNIQWQNIKTIINTAANESFGKHAVSLAPVGY